MPRLIRRSPSESKSTTRSAGRARARPSAKPACPPIAGSPSGTSRPGRVLILVQCGPPRPGTTMASPRWALKMRSMSAVWNTRAASWWSLAIEPVVLVGHQHRDRPLRAAGLLERDGDARRVGRALDEVVGDAEGVEEALGVGGRAVRVHPVARPPAVAHHQHHRDLERDGPAPERVARLHEARVLDEDDR